MSIYFTLDFTLDNPKREISTVRGNVNDSGRRFTFPVVASVKTS
jgi:hypothetical protein